LAGLSKRVREYRLQRMQAFMRSHGYDALAFTGSDWFEWASNHSITSLAFERPFLLLVTADGRLLAIMCELDRNPIAAQEKRGELWLDSVAYYAESSDTGKHPWIASQLRDMVVDMLGTAGLRSGRIGLDGGGEWLMQAVAALHAVQVTRAGPALRSLRWIKHSEELDTMRRCASLSDWAIDAYRHELRPGRLLDEVDYVVAAKLAAEAARRMPGENYKIVKLLTLSGVTSACPSGDGALTGKLLENDTVASTTIATRLNGLAMELARPWLVGSPSRRALMLFDCAYAAQQAAIDAAIAGRPVAGIHTAAQRVFDDAGFGEHLRIRSGHGIGVVQHDFPTDLPFENRLLLEHEAYAVEPGLFFADLGAFRFADTIAVGASAPEHITRASKERAALALSS
jgi:Xaa-Pro aminopeptidase